MPENRNPSLRAGRQNALHRCALTGLALALVSLLVPPLFSSPEQISWGALLAPYSGGAPLLGEFHLDEIRRGSARDVVLVIVDGAGAIAAEVHVLPRGSWPGVRESRSFSIAYETPRSPSPRREEITELLAATLRARDDGLPPPDVLPIDADSDSTTLSRWLQLLHGWRGIALGFVLLLSGLVMLVPSPPAGAVAALFAAGVLTLLPFGLSPGRVDLFGPWALPLAAVLTAAGAHRVLAPARADWFGAAAIAAVAIALRLVLGPWAPLHVNGYGPRFIAGAVSDPEAIASYGPGYVEIFGWAGALTPTNADWLIFASNALLSGLGAVLAFALARGVGIERNVAVAAALLLAIDPVAISGGATESYFPAIIFLCSAAAVSEVVAALAVRAGDRHAAAACMVGAALLLVQALRLHPAAWLPAATVPLLLLAGCGGTPWRRLSTTALGGMVIAGVVVATNGDSLLDVLGNVQGGVLMRPTVLHSLWSVAGGTAVVALLAAAAPSRWLGPAAVASIAALLLTRDLYWQSWIWRQSYDRLFLTVPVLVFADAIASRLPYRVYVASGLAVAGLLAWLVFAPSIISFRTTDQLEYRWLRHHIRDIPESCRVVHLAAVGNRGVEIPTYVRPSSAPVIAISPHRPYSQAEAFPPDTCVYYIHTSMCSSVEAGAECAAIENALEIDPVARTSFPAQPSSFHIPYDRDPVPSWIARVHRRTAGDGTGQ